MTTSERELTEPVDLCTPDGQRRNPHADGWSRTPLHTANLKGSWGRNKRWDYWAILAEDFVMSSVYADVDYIGLADVWWVDLATGESGGRGIVDPLARSIELPDKPATAPLVLDKSKLELSIVDEADGSTRISAAWREPEGQRGACEITVGMPEGHESLNVVIPWSDTRFQYTSKHQARPVHGWFKIGSDRRELDGAWGVLDVGRGRWPYKTTWNWGGGAGHATDGTVIGIQVGAKWTEGTGYTENGVIIDGTLTKIGRELSWDYDWDDPMRPWTVVDPGGNLDLVLTPRYDKHTKVNGGVLSTETHQVFGTWSGTVTDDAGNTYTVEGISGFAEESRSRW